MGMLIFGGAAFLLAYLALSALERESSKGTYAVLPPSAIRAALAGQQKDSALARSITRREQRRKLARELRRIKELQARGRDEALR